MSDTYNFHQPQAAREVYRPSMREQHERAALSAAARRCRQEAQASRADDAADQRRANAEARDDRAYA
jgi:hypothetical protein